MEIIIIQSLGKHPENKMFRECLNFQRAFTHIGIKSKIYCGGILKDILTADSILLILENYHNSWIPNLSGLKNYKIFWSIDGHCNLKNHLQFVKTHKINLVLNSNKQFVSRFMGVRSIWFPNCYPADLIDQNNESKKFDVGFCGRLLNRGAWLNHIDRHFKVKRDIFILGDAMVKAINSYRVGWNHSYKNDLNYRVFETMGCGTALVTDEVQGIRDLFIDGEDLLLYKSVPQCIEQIKFLLNNNVERIRIEGNGYQKVKTQHTFVNRAADLIKIIKTRG